MMPQPEQDHTCQYPGRVDAHIPDTGSPVRYKPLDGLVHCRCQNTPEKGAELSCLQHSMEPGKTHSQSRELGKMCQFPQQAAAGVLLLSG